MSRGIHDTSYDGHVTHRAVIVTKRPVVTHVLHRDDVTVTKFRVTISYDDHE